MANAATWLDYVTAIGSVATPILVLILSGIGWRIKAGVERRIALESLLRDERIEIYNKILEPFIIVLTSDAAWASDKKHKKQEKGAAAQAKLLSFEYREQGFKLSLLGSDEVVKAYNNLMQYFYATESTGETKISDAQGAAMLKLLGTLLLEIRRSMGNDATKLDLWDMCEWWMKDARSLRQGDPVA